MYTHKRISPLTYKSSIHQNHSGALDALTISPFLVIDDNIGYVFNGDKHMKCKYWYWGIWLQYIEELPLNVCIVRNLLLRQCTFEELNHGDLPLYLVIHTRIWYIIWRIWNAWWNMVPDEIQHACNDINKEISMQSIMQQKYQRTIGIKFTTWSNKSLKRTRVVT